MNKSGSIMWYFQEVTQVSRATGNTVRKAAAGLLQSHSYLHTQVSVWGVTIRDGYTLNFRRSDSNTTVSASRKNTTTKN